MNTELSDFVREKRGGKFSITRLIFVIWCLTVLGAWVYVSIVNKQLQAIDTSIVGILGSLGLTKLSQRFAENKTSTNVTTTTSSSIIPK